MFRIEVTKTYDLKKEWVEDQQMLMRQCGVDNNPTVFMFNDTQIFNEMVLEDVSSILNQGEIPNLFDMELKAKICEDLNVKFSRETDIMSTNQKYSFFTKICKNNLHMIVTLSPVGDDYRKRMRTFPSLINCSTLDWFLPWPVDALRSVSNSILDEMKFEEDQKKKISTIFVDMQERATTLGERFLQEHKKYYYVTPTSYLELLAAFSKMLVIRKTQNHENVARYVKGLDRLLDAESSVSVMKVELIALQPKLKIANEETDILIVKVKKEQIEADAAKTICDKDAEVCGKQREEANGLKELCQTALAKVEPILEAALKNLDTIERKHIDFIKAMAKPPMPIQKLYKALVICWEIKNVPMLKDPNDQFKKIPDYATPCKTQIINNPMNLLKTLKSFDEAKITSMDPKTIKDIRDMFDNDVEFTIDRLGASAEAAGKIGNFLEAVVEVYDKLLIINPKREELKQAEASLELAESTLKEKMDSLKVIEDKIAKLNAELDEAMGKKQHLESEVQRCTRQLGAAEQLISGLATEKVNWGKRAETLRGEEQYILGDIILCSGIIAYLGAFPSSYREQSIDQWTELCNKSGITVSPSFELRNIVSDEITIGNWTNIFKLPNDSFSIDNAIIMVNSRRYPLFIDPQVQANRWIKELEGKNNLIKLKPSSSGADIQNMVQSAMELGYPVLVENVDEKIDSSFTSV